MECKTEYTVGELLRIALGSPHLKKENLDLLHAVLHYLLNRMDCQREVIIVEGVAANCLRELLPQCKEPLQLTKKDSVCADLMGHERFNRIETLDKFLISIEGKYSEHLSKIRECNRINDKEFDSTEWDKYSSQNEDLCTCPGVDAREFCKFLGNAYFIFKLRHNILTPVIKKIVDFENIIAKLNKALEKFANNNEENMDRLKMVDSITSEIVMLNKKFENNAIIFINAMEEVDNMLIAKTDRIFLPTLTNCLKKNFERVEHNMKHLRNKLLCPKPAPNVIEENQCLSCGSSMNHFRNQKLKRSKRRRIFHKECHKPKCFDYTELRHMSAFEKKISETRESVTKDRPRGPTDDLSEISAFSEPNKTAVTSFTSLFPR